MERKILLLFIFLSFQLHAQEICTNGIDDDGDGLIDLNDTVDCRCNGIRGNGVVLPSYIPNPSFEQQHCCPYTYSQMNCAAGWVQASFATSDYMSHCPGGYVGGAVIAAGLNNFPDGDAIVGCIFQPNWQEYVGSCLLQPLQAGTSYTIQMNIASTPVDGQGGECNGGNIFYGPVDITIFGSTSCANLPFAGSACPAAPAWRIMGHATYTPVARWGILTITFTPSFTANAIILGAPCALPAGYNTNLGCSPYFYFDNLILNTTAAFGNLNIKENGIPCLNNCVLTSHVDTTGGSWQWFRNGIALTGQTDSILNYSANHLSDGYYSAMYSIGNQCQLTGDSVISHVPHVDVTSHVDVYCEGGNDGYAFATGTGGYGSLSYMWNTNPPQVSQAAYGLSERDYVVTVSDSVGCHWRDTVAIRAMNVSPHITNTLSICNGDFVQVGAHAYNTTGNYYDTLATVSGCDSVIVTNLTVMNRFAVNNPQWICGTGAYDINGHSYTSPGTYYDTLISATGCDSVVITILASSNNSHVANNVHLCHGENYIINNHQYSQAGIYLDTLRSIHGCDSVIETSITIMPASVINVNQTICPGDHYDINNHSYNTPGVYSDTVRTGFGCDSVIITNLTIKPRPLLLFDKPDDVCIDAEPFELKGGKPPGGYYAGPGVMNNRFYPAAASTGIHTITYSYTDGLTSCSNTADQNITVHALPEIQFTLNPKATFLANSKITFLDYTANAQSWKWDFGDSCTAEQRYGFHYYKDTGYYQVSIIVIDNHGCAASASDGIYIGLEFAFNVPNAFTPNGDGINDTFNGVGIGIGKYQMSIFDRWGKEIFTSHNLFQPWRGEGAIEDAYVYKINLEDITGKAYEYVGQVSLIK